MEPIYAYQDFRSYLRDYQEHKQLHGRAFSVRGFLKKAGIGSPSFFSQVLAGERNLTERTLGQFLLALQLPPQEADYFRALVRFTQARSSEEKQFQYARMHEIAGSAKVRTVGESSFGFYEKWYIPVLRELLCLHATPDNAAEIGRSLHPPIGATEVRQATRRLLELGFLIRTPEGKYQQTEPLLSTGFEVHSMAVRQFNKQMVELAAQSLDGVPVPERSVTGVTMAVSAATYRLITEEIRTLQDRILQLVESDPEANRIYQLNVLLFPVSKAIENTVSAPEAPL